jgi:hypothetical protein
MRKLLFIAFILALLLEPKIYSSLNKTIYSFSLPNNLPKTNEKLNVDELYKWDKIADDLMSNQSTVLGIGFRLTAYLFNAQRDFAILSKQITGTYSGNFGPVSIGIIQLFYPQYSPSSSIENINDPFSQALANIILPKYSTRFEEEQSNIKDYPIKYSPDAWSFENFPYGLAFGNLKPWTLTSADQFRVPQPPAPQDKFWKDQIVQVQEEMSHLNPIKIGSIYFWAGILGTGDSGYWIEMLNEYMREHNIPLEKQLEARSLIGMAVYDAEIACYDSKYTYWVKRPNMVDENIKTVIPVPNHPSYPAGHSVNAYAVMTVSNYMFPENKEEWTKYAIECGMSRIWAGLHFPIDNSAGNKQGQQVAEATIKKWSQ